MSNFAAHQSTAPWRLVIFIGTVALQLFVAIASIALISALRIVVNGESLWSKELNTAYLELSHYAQSGEPQVWEKFERSMLVPLSIGKARENLDSDHRDIAFIRQKLIDAGNQPQDVDYLLRILPYIWNQRTLDSIIALWRQADRHVIEAQAIGNKIYTAYRHSHSVPESQIINWQTEISTHRLQTLEISKNFSEILDKYSSHLNIFLFLINLCTAAFLIAMYWLTMHHAKRERAAANQRLHTEKQQSSKTLAALADGVITLDEKQRIQYANAAALQLLNTHQDNLKNSFIQERLPFVPDLISQHQKKSKKNSETPLLSNEKPVYWIPQGSEASKAVHISITDLHQEHSHGGYVLVLHDVSQEQNYVRMLAWQQSHDLLTGLENRLEFEKYLQQILGKQQASLLHLNLDHFKMINASYGHAAGDEILRQVCQQLRLTLRESDLLARIGGDEFAALLTHCPPHAAMQTAERLRQTLHNLTVTWRNQTLHTGVSIGVVHLDPAQRNNAQDLLAMADSACKHAKESGRNRITVYNPLDRVFHRYQGDMEWVQRLRHSLEHDHFSLFAQTVYPLQPNEKSGMHFEVLLRLFDNNDHQLSPGEFIPIAERYDLMPQIDRWVVKKTLKILKNLLSQGTNINTCSINLSGTSLGDTEILEFIRYNILEQGISAEKLCFEITETSAIASLEKAICMISELRKLGCRFSLDDFGSGMASFKYLQQLPVDYLKIDGSFVRDMLKNSNNYAMVETINHIGHIMGKRTVAEFVGDHDTFKALQKIGVDYAQGYYISAPIPLDDNFIKESMRTPHLQEKISTNN